jgi:tetratricopeptide (TPR) repeat protein
MPRAWKAFPYDATACTYTAAALKKHWARLHRGDAEPWPTSKTVQQAWIFFHAGNFQEAVSAGLKAGGAGVHAANKAQAIYATYLAPDESTKQALLLEVVHRAEARALAAPDEPNAWYWQAYALGRYSQSISVAQAIAHGYAPRIKHALEQAIHLAPTHADAHIALGMFHAEVIHKVGQLLGHAQGADKATGLRSFERALALNPESAIARIEMANGLVMLEGDKQLKRAERLYAEAAAATPMDAMERLDVELAKAEIAA